MAPRAWPVWEALREEHGEGSSTTVFETWFGKMHLYFIPLKTLKRFLWIGKYLQCIWFLFAFSSFKSHNCIYYCWLFSPRDTKEKCGFVPCKIPCPHHPLKLVSHYKLKSFHTSQQWICFNVLCVAFISPSPFRGLLVADLVFVPSSMAVLILLLQRCPVMQLLLLATNLQVFQIWQASSYSFQEHFLFSLLIGSFLYLSEK